MSLLSDISYSKIIPSNYSSIKHLSGSKLIDSGDSLLDPDKQAFFIEKIQFPKRDKIYVTEKVDGCNVGVVKINGKLHPIIRKGYDVRQHEMGFVKEFADFVFDNESRFDALLSDSERICGEWMIKTHSLFYDMPHEPFIAFDIIKSGTKPIRINYDEVMKRCKELNFVTSGLVWEGEAIPVKDALDKLGKGFHGCLSEPEGVVYRYERDGIFYSAAKYVANLDVTGVYMNDEMVMNKWIQWR